MLSLALSISSGQPRQSGCSATVISKSGFSKDYHCRQMRKPSWITWGTARFSKFCHSLAVVRTRRSAVTSGSCSLLNSSKCSLNPDIFDFMVLAARLDHLALAAQFPVFLVSALGASAERKAEAESIPPLMASFCMLPECRGSQLMVERQTSELSHFVSLRPSVTA